MKRLALAGMMLLAAPAMAQQPVGPEQHGVVITSSTGLTVPLGANAGVVCAKVGTANFRMDGTAPTGTVGSPLLPNTCMLLCRSQLLAARFIEAPAAAGTTIEVAYQTNNLLCV